MFLYWHRPVISYHIEASFFHSTGRKVPITGVSNVGFVKGFTIDKKFPFSKLHLFPFQGHDSLKKHSLVPCKADRYDITPLGLRKKITDLHTEIESPISVSGFHTRASNKKGSEDMAKNEIGENPN
jgi:hypothetical protein